MNTNTICRIRPAGRHILTIGRDLIQDNYAAVLELVKNAYDADSPDVHLEFKAFDDLSGYSIVVSDHGHGMSTDDIINKWMVPSTSDKRDRRKSPLGRMMQGSKGVGRYATSILGSNLYLETVTTVGEKTTVYLEWEPFKDATYLDDVEIIVETEKTSEPQGTRLTIEGDKEFLSEWGKGQFYKLRDELKKLQSPVSTVFGKDEFCIKLTVNDFPEEVENIDETIEPYPLFDLFDYRISGKINENGKGTLTYSCKKARNTIEEEIPLDLEKDTGCGELDIDIRVYDREPEAINTLISRGLTDESGEPLGKNEARRLLNTYNGIGVYRNGFRIRPLGERTFDWLELDKRRVNIPARCVGSNQTIGYVQIQAQDQSGLIEKSARDGLRENTAFNQLKAITTLVITQLEWRRYHYRRKEGLSRPIYKIEQNLQQLFSSEALKRNVRTQLDKGAKAEKIIELIEQDAKDKNKVAEEIRQVVAIYQGQATLGKIINVILHEGRQPLSYFRNQIPNLRRRYEFFRKTKSQTAFERLMRIAEGIEQNMDFFVKLFSRLDPLAAGRRPPRKPLKLKKTIEGTLDVFESQLETHKISVQVKGADDFMLSVWEQDLYTIFTNLIDNSLYWIREKDVPTRKIMIEIQTNGDTLNCIDYHDTGPGIEPSLIESEVIFEPQFSTKPDGTGLGLAIAGEAANRNKLELKVLESEEGAHFILQPKMENEK
ncbi:MAG: sensor histidine kinase [Gammaproteobacteria bacterium]|nr:sensor histidine kinase [Candidatus Poribacteria bacterium]MYK43386.1 sensor histidine kinase [Gammaproteobacteria bacterium]